MIGGGLALLGIEVTIGVVAEHCGGLTIPTVDHFPLINAGWPVAKTSLMGRSAAQKSGAKAPSSNTTPASQPAFMGGGNGPR